MGQDGKGKLGVARKPLKGNRRQEKDLKKKVPSKDKHGSTQSASVAHKKKGRKQQTSTERFMKTRTKLKQTPNSIEIAPADEEERRLEAELFGGDFTEHAADDLNISFLDEPAGDIDAPALDDDGDFVQDDTHDNDDDDGIVDSKPKPTAKQNQEAMPKAAWHDEDDDKLKVHLELSDRLKKFRKSTNEKQVSGTEYQLRLRNQHEKLSRSSASWATTQQKKKRQTSDSDDDGDGEDAIHTLMQSTESLLHDKRAGPLPPTIIAVQRLPNANTQGVSKCVVQAAKFHPSTNLLTTAGFDHHVRVFRVDGRDNTLVHASFVADLPILHARWSYDGRYITVAGTKSHFYRLDLEQGATVRYNAPLVRKHELGTKGYVTFACHPQSQQLVFVGHQGNVIVTNPHTQKELFTMNARSNIHDIAFLPDGNRLVSVGDEGLMHVFDLRMRRCVHVAQDEGSLHTTALSVSPSFIATGNSSGVVNMYDSEQVLNNSNPSPIKAILNLTTNISSVCIHPQEQTLAIASKRTKGALKLTHIPSYHVYRNWPKATTPLNYVSCVDFSCKGGLMAIGNDKGSVLLYRLKHFSEA